MNEIEILALIKHYAQSIYRGIDGPPYEFSRKAENIEKEAQRILDLSKELK